MPQSLLLPQATRPPDSAASESLYDEPRWLDPHEVFDELLSRVVINRLADSGYHHLRQVQVMAIDGRICLLGCLPTYFLKQMAQETAAATPGVSHVENRVSVEKNG